MIMPSVLTVPKKLLRSTTGNAVLEIEKESGGKSTFACQFNPDELHFSSQVKMHSINRKKKDLPIIQYMGGNSSVLDLRLFFDTSTSYEIKTGSDKKPTKEKAKDVSVYIGTILSMVQIQDKVSRPPVVTFRWGSIKFSGFVDNVDVKYTMFEMGGVPVRAEVSFKITSTDLLETKVGQNKAKGASNQTKCVTITVDDNIWNVAEKECGDSSAWREVAKENKIMNPMEVKAGTQLKVPAKGKNSGKTRNTRKTGSAEKTRRAGKNRKGNYR